jgi:hypothetical protein
MALTSPMNVNVLGGGSIASDSTTGRAVGDFIPEKWSGAILDSFTKTSVMLKVCRDHSGALAGGGDVVHLPYIGSVAVSDAPQMGSALTFDNTGDTGAKLSITVNQHDVAHLLLPDLVKIQASYDLTRMYATQIGEALAEAIDNYIVGTTILNSGSFSSASGPVATVAVDTGSVLDVDGIAAKCVAQSGSTRGWNLILGPTLYSSLAGLASGAGLVYGTAGSPAGSSFATTGNIGTIMGMPVFVTNNAYMDNTTVSAVAGKNIAAWNGLDTDDGTADNAFRGLAIHDDALHVAFSKKASLNVSYEHMYLAHLLSSEVAFGVAMNHDTNTDGKRRIMVLHD